MTVIELEESGGRRSAPTGPNVPMQRKPASSDWIENLRSEIDSYMEQMQTFPGLPSDEIFLMLSAWTARATELRIQLSRSDTQKARSFNSKEIDPFLDECERQFRFHSRVQSYREQEFKLSGGQV